MRYGWVINKNSSCTSSFLLFVSISGSCDVAGETSPILWPVWGAAADYRASLGWFPRFTAPIRRPLSPLNRRFFPLTSPELEPPPPEHGRGQCSPRRRDERSQCWGCLPTCPRPSAWSDEVARRARAGWGPPTGSDERARHPFDGTRDWIGVMDEVATKFFPRNSSTNQSVVVPPPHEERFLVGTSILEEFICKDASEGLKANGEQLGANILIFTALCKRDTLKSMVSMEVAVVSGILKIVGNKLAPLLIKEYSSIVGVAKDLQELQGQVEEINNWLETAGNIAMGNGSSFSWLKSLKSVSYDVDDLIDELYLEVEKHYSGGDDSTMSKYLCTNPKYFLFQCKAAHKVKAIKGRFASIVKQRNDFSTITNSLQVGHLVRHMNKAAGEMPLLPNIDVASVLGRDKEKHKIISKLIETYDQQRVKIVSVIGLGGCGKTTLAKLVFNDDNIQKHFKIKLWVHVSREFDVAKLVEKLFEVIAGEKSERYPLQHMCKTISDNLTGKRYLIVLDDVWTEDQILWDQFMVHLKNGTPGSGILLTTCSRKVAEAVRSRDQFDLPFLSPDDSWQLFKQSLVMPAEGLGLEFAEIGKEIVGKCGGVPLAIKVLAGVLHDKERIEEWHAMRHSNLLDVEGEERSVSVSACLRLSYFHLPSHLKQCFTLCSVFPKGHFIDKEELIDLWIAHDMISVEGVDYLEYIGHKYFISLVQVSFLQDVDESCGRVRCKMHDLVHDLARSILGDEISIVAPVEATGFTKSYRYFSLIKQPRSLLPKNIFRKTRALYVDGGDNLIFGKAMKNAKHLRSITMESLHTTSVPIAILQIKNLRYLSISRENFEILPEAISDIWGLQSLHVTVCVYLLKLPESIGKLQKLRTLNLSYCPNLKSLPDSVGDCHMISSVDLYSCEGITVLPNSIGRNKRLRELRLGSTKIERLPSSIRTLENLELLDLRWCCNLVELPEAICNLENLRVLNTRGCEKLIAMPIGIGQLSRLQNLSTFVVGKGEKSAAISTLRNAAMNSQNLNIRGIACVKDPEDAYRVCLKEKTKLQALELNWETNGSYEVNTETDQAVLNGLEPPSGIRNLNIAGYTGRQYARWMLKQVGGVQNLQQFPFLTMMRLSDFQNLKHLEGLMGLPCLEHLWLSGLTSLESISGGPFPSLVKLVMDGLPRLEEVWMVTQRCLGIEDGIMLIGTCLSDLHVEGCPKLMVKPYFPLSLQRLLLKGSNEELMQSPDQGQGCSSSSGSPRSFSFSHLKELTLQEMTISSRAPGFVTGRGWQLLQHMTSLESLKIGSCYCLMELPESMRSLMSLQYLYIEVCYGIRTLPEWLGELRSLQKMSIGRCHSLTSLPQSMGELQSLQQMIIDHCNRLSSLPQSINQLCSLQEMIIKRCPSLDSLPESIDKLCSLQKMVISGCCRLTSLPKSLGHLTSLQVLQITHCDELQLLPECLGELRFLRRLEISLTRLTSLPQSMCQLTFLEELSISYCWGIKSLPDWIKGLTALQKLGIYNCPDLKRRCEWEKDDWHLISHIPHLYIH
ncbi:hypothetical protein ACP4OV_014868 [Aristida adscensionis]